LLREALPQLPVATCPSKISLDVYVSISSFTDYTKHALEEHNFKQVKKCFAMAENLYLQGDSLVRFLIENSFLYSLGSFMSKSASENFMAKSVLPDTLYKLYRKQLKN